MMELGPSEQNIVKQAIRSRQPIPDRIANAPDLELGLWFYIQAFFDLVSERSIGFGIGQIPWSSIAIYGRHYELSDEEIELLFRYVHALDVEHLKWLNEKE